MSHDVIISYSTKDKPIADAVCVALEANGVRCWVAPRDIVPGTDWGEAIIDAINDCRLMVLVFSLNANASPQIKREVERAANRGIPIIPYRIEDVHLSKTLEYFISTTHWLDALSPPMESHLQDLARVVKMLLDRKGRGDDGAGTREPPQLIPQPPTASDQYKAAVEVAWSNKKIDALEVESLTAVARRIGLAESTAAEIEREVMGDTKQALALRGQEEMTGKHARLATEDKADAGVKPRHTFCRKCGDRIVAGDKFCRKCGERLA